MLNSSDLPSTGSEGEQVKNLVRSQVLQNWEAQDEPEHLKTIRDRILRSGSNTSRLLGLYQHLQKEVAADDSPEQTELRLSGLVVRHEGKLRVYNRIYESIFNGNWVEKELANLRPYASSLSTWVAANCEDESRLLRGQALQDALSWANGKSLSDRDYQFLAASQELDKREVQIALEAERKPNHILSQAQQKAKHQLKEAQEGTRIERAGVKALRLFEAGGRGNMLAKKGEVKEAIATFAEAQKLDPMLEISAYSWNNLCWFGSLHGYAAEVMHACENAVALDPENVGIRDSRGLARALSGDIEGAIADFQAFVDFWADNDEKRLQRLRWIDALRAGDRPFTPEKIETLLNKYY